MFIMRIIILFWIEQSHSEGNNISVKFHSFLGQSENNLNQNDVREEMSWDMSVL